LDFRLVCTFAQTGYEQTHTGKALAVFVLEVLCDMIVRGLQN
jgi:hypothetical protein